MFKETKKRSIYKALSWRVIALLNSWIVLAVAFTDSSFWNAFTMNVIGFFLYFIFERFWNKIKYGRINE
jgi:uncharacterized membrane protein